VNDNVEGANETATETKPENVIPEESKKSKGGFDWVTARSSCSLPKVFKDLLLQVETDVKTRNALRPKNSPYEFSVAQNGEDFSVLLKTRDLQKSVVFGLGEHAILVRDDKGNQMFQVTLDFNEAGECKLRVNDQDREAWQVRRLALEGLMFHA
jgi:hypothetical protein